MAAAMRSSVGTPPAQAAVTLSASNTSSDRWTGLFMGIPSSAPAECIPPARVGRTAAEDTYPRKASEGHLV